MEKGWIKIYNTTASYKAELYKGILEDSGIDSVIMDKQDSFYVTIGEIELFVKQDDAVRAMNIIKNQES